MGGTTFWLFAGWLPLWLILLLANRPRAWTGVALGTALAAFVGGMCCVELRRHGLLGAPPGAYSIPVLGIQPHELLRFGLCGFTGALAAELLLRKWPVRPPENSVPKGGERETTRGQ